MARSKSIPGSKANRVDSDANTITNNNKEKAGVSEPVKTASPANLPDVKSVAAETATSAVRPKTTVETKPAVTSAPESRKLEITKSDSRKNLVPINLDDEIRRRAYELYEQRGSSYGSETQDWLIAESEVRQRYHQRSA